MVEGRARPIRSKRRIKADLDVHPTIIIHPSRTLVKRFAKKKLRARARDPPPWLVDMMDNSMSYPHNAQACPVDMMDNSMSYPHNAPGYYHTYTS